MPDDEGRQIRAEGEHGSRDLLGFPDSVLGDVGDRDGGTGSGERQGGGAADTARRARDEGDFAGQIMRLRRRSLQVGSSADFQEDEAQRGSA